MSYSLILNQYRKNSSYKDVTGKSYHFPNRHLNAFVTLPVPFIYYEPREGGEQVYFGTGVIYSISEDTEDVGHSYAEIGQYKEFPNPIDYYTAPVEIGPTWEPSKNMRSSVRKIPSELFEKILFHGQVKLPDFSQLSVPDYSVLSSQKELARYPGPGSRTPPVLRRIKRVLETYERPSFITNKVKRDRNYQCQLCGAAGFLKRSGVPYCEVHHLFHLSEDPPVNCLTPEYVVVLCATCHRKMHYSHVSIPQKTNFGWTVNVDGFDVFFKTENW
jgi:5-methylcytosine-specific restriction endonuclease McrA